MNSTAANMTTAVEVFPESVTAATKRIAPTWPLDASIAVNPWWQMRHQSPADIAANLETLGHIKCLMPVSYYQEAWQKLVFEQHLDAAAKELKWEGRRQELLAFLTADIAPPAHWHNLAELLDALPDHKNKMHWRDEIRQQISQFCALYFQYPERMQGNFGEHKDVYREWLEVVRQDRGIEVLMGESGLHKQFNSLPDCPKALCQMVEKEFAAGLNFDEYCYALLLDIHGWASWMAYTAWQDAFINRDNSSLEQLLAIRLAWDWVLWRHHQTRAPGHFQGLRNVFLSQFAALPAMRDENRAAQAPLWVWQRALEIAYQDHLHALFTKAPISTAKQKNEKNEDAKVALPPKLQAVFCIDVRSEPMRRALEAQDTAIETFGFAGFFGLPIEYLVNGHADTPRAQLPGLLKASIQVSQTQSIQLDKNQKNHGNPDLKSENLRFLHRQHRAFDSSPASLGLVEMLGIQKAFTLLKNSVGVTKTAHPINSLCDDRPFIIAQNGTLLSASEQAELAANVLTNLGLKQDFADTVLLLGHGACSANNPQAAALDCGACGGQSGEVNVKVLAQMLNDAEVRRHLVQRDIVIPRSTRFVAGLHNTTSDKIHCYGESLDPKSKHWLQQAEKLAQDNRAESVGINRGSNTEKAFAQRSNNWAELRPEWGLANNAAFIVAPRKQTRQLNLEGRAFLHDYKWQEDHDFSILELIMTAPMIVTNWINLQYYASVCDNDVYGSGNKMLHNVVGEHIGVFEGNGGDLRIGLAKQSLHDGQTWRHQPLRLSVYITAPQDAIATIIAKHKMLQELINNQWLFLFQFAEDKRQISRYINAQWQPLKEN